MKKQKSPSQKKTLKRVLHYISKYWLYITLSLLFAIVSVGFTLYIPVLTGRAIDSMKEAGAVDFAVILGLVKNISVLIGIVGVSQWIMNVCNNKVTFSVIRDIRKDAFNKIQNVPLSFVDKHAYGEIVSRVIADVDQFADGLLLGFSQLFTGIITILGTLCFMLSINIGITAVVVVVTPVSLLVASFIAKRTYDMFKKQSATRGEQTALVEEVIGNQKVVKAYQKEEDMKSRFDEINERLKKYSLKAVFFSSIVNPSTRFVNSLVYTSVGLTGALCVMSEIITVGGLSCFLTYANQYTKPFNEISGVVTELQNALACAERIFELIDVKAQEPDSDNAKTLIDAKGNVVFDNVCFSYTKDKKLIENLNLSASVGQRIAIVGPTGCGKTTVINLLMRFYDVNSGSISVDGENIENYTRQSLRQNFGMVLQDTWIKTGTVKENIAIGKPDATDEEIIAAAKATHAHSFIKRLPNGYDTVISDDKGGLSQGQKQLLCIARVMLNKPPILILDEATSSIDTRTEMRIQKAFAKLMEGRTSFIVAHRLSTIKEADLILVMKDGNIIEQGNHKQLLSKKGFYYNLYNSQFEN